MKTAKRFLLVLRAFLSRVCGSVGPERHASHARAFARPLRASPATGLVAAINDSALIGAVGAINEAVGANEWLRVAPFGEWPNPVGLQVFDREAADSIVSAFNTASTKAAT